jgi:predicted nucleotidyltransferase
MNQTKLTAFEQTLLKIDRVCCQHRLEYVVIGGVAIMYYLQYRATRDIDISLCLDLQQIEPVGDILLHHFDPIFDQPLEFFGRHFVLPLIDPQTQIRVDVSAGLGGFERMAVAHAKRVRFAQVEINICSIEDLIIFKLVAARPIDLADAEMLVQKYQPELDKQYLLQIAYEFAQLERADVIEKLQSYFDKHATT